LSILTQQFTPIEDRQRILQEGREHILPGGAFVLVEKILMATAELDGIMVETYYRLKSANGYSQEETEGKRLSLEGVLVSVTARWNAELLDRAGFQ
jgi:tRNA (cmo5U34)-methyltransferase